MSANILKFSGDKKKTPECSAWKRRSHFKQLKKIALVDTRPDLYLILRFLCVPLEEAHVPLVVLVPHFENHCSSLLMTATKLDFDVTDVI